MVLFSKKLNGAQLIYTATKKECLAVIQSIQHFAVYLISRKFVVQTDHKALQQLRIMENSNQGLMRWFLMLQPYEFDVEHHPGRKYFISDGLSRQNYQEPAAEEDRLSECEHELCVCVCVFVTVLCVYQAVFRQRL